MKPKILTVKKLIELNALVNATPGHALVERFCNAVAAGETPATEDLETLARALEHLRYGRTKRNQDNEQRAALANFSKTLRLTKKQGRQKRGGAYFEFMARPIIRFLHEQEALLNAGKSPSYARQKARQIAIEHEARNTGDAELSTDAFNRRLQKYLPLARRYKNYFGK